VQNAQSFWTAWRTAVADGIHNFQGTCAMKFGWLVGRSICWLAG